MRLTSSLSSSTPLPASITIQSTSLSLSLYLPPSLSPFFSLSFPLSLSLLLSLPLSLLLSLPLFFPFLSLTLSLSSSFVPSLTAPLLLRRALCHRWQEYTSVGKLRVGIGTWNVNGGRHVRSIALKNHSMHEWLLDAPLTSHKAATAVSSQLQVVGYQLISSSSPHIAP